MVVRCKFKCISKTETDSGISVVMLPVTCGSPENELFFKYTPYGELKIGTLSPSVADELKVGRQYYLDIVPAE